MIRVATVMTMPLVLLACDPADDAGAEATTETETEVEDEDGTALTETDVGDVDTTVSSDTSGEEDTVHPDTGDGAAIWPDEKYLGIDFVYERVRQNDSDMVLLNVSDEEFYDMGHIAGSLKIPWDLLPNRLEEVPADRRIVVYCRRGVRSESAYETLKAASYPRVWLMQDGLEAWISAGYPTVAE